MNKTFLKIIFIAQMELNQHTIFLNLVTFLIEIPC